MFNWHAMYFLRILIPYVLGVFTSFYLLGSPWQIVLLFVPGLVLAVFYIFQKPEQKFGLDTGYGVALFLLMFALGSFRQYTYNELNTPTHFSKNKNTAFLLAEIAEETFERENFIRCRVTVKGGFDSLENFTKASGSILVYFRKPSDRELYIGDELLIGAEKVAEVQSPKNPGEFNYKRFLSYKNIYFQVFLDREEWAVTGNRSFSVYRTAAQSRRKVMSILETVFEDKDQRAFAEALLLGYKNNLNTEIVDSFSKTGTLHVLAVSGMHAGIIFLILNLLCKPLNRVRKGHVVRGLVIITGIWFYAFVTGLSPSVQRAAIMLSIVQAAVLFRRKSRTYNSLFASAFAILLVNPFLIVSVSFQLSYTAVWGIVFFQPKIKKWYKPSTKFTAYIWDLIAISFAAQLATFPLGIFYFYQFPLYFLLSNLVVIPAIFLSMYTLIATVFLFWIPFAGQAIVWVAKGVILFILHSVRIMETLPSSSIENLYLSPLQIVLLYLLMVSVSWWLVSRQKRYLSLSLLLVTLFSVSGVIRAHTLRKHNFAVIHSINRHCVVSVVQGRTAVVIANPEFLEDKNARRFYLRPFISENGLRSVRYVHWSDSLQNENFVLKNNTLYFGNSLLMNMDKWLLMHQPQENSSTALLFKEYDKWRIENLAKKDFSPDIQVLDKWIEIRGD